MKNVKLLVVDVDGTLTDGGLNYDSVGGEHKRFHVADGLGITMAQASGLEIAIVSGRSNDIVARRMHELGVRAVIQGVGDKSPALRKLRDERGLARDEIAYIGDDLNDLPAFDEVGVKIAVANATEYVLKIADFVTVLPGGSGAVREAIEAILKSQGRYDEAVQSYLEIARVKVAPSTQ